MSCREYDNGNGSVGLRARLDSLEISKTGNATPPLTDDEEKVSATVDLTRISRRRIRLGCTVAAEENELLPAMILWDLLDPANEPHDAIAATDIATADSLFRFVPMATRANRGAAGADLVDFLDGWRLAMGETATVDSGLCGILKERNFNYQFPDGRSCP